ncbi:hypothetical protein I4U23_024172 [Adineta vaga]|nr:hypothetical protein I4U23_024172 [Adineta vaga]
MALESYTTYPKPLNPDWNFKISVWHENDIYNWTSKKFQKINLLTLFTLNDSAWLDVKDHCIIINTADVSDDTGLIHI